MRGYDFADCNLRAAIDLINDSGSMAEYMAACWAIKLSAHPSGPLDGRIILEHLANNGAFFDDILAEQWLIDLGTTNNSEIAI